jgi:predicted phage tail protein
MITITNSKREILEIESEVTKSITTDINLSVGGMQLLNAIQTIQSQNMELALQAKSMTKYKDMHQDKIMELPESELEQLISVSKNASDKTLKIQVAQDLIKYFGLEEANLSISNISKIFTFVTADEANSFQF